LPDTLQGLQLYDPLWFAMNKIFLYEFLRGHKYGVMSSITPDARPESALVGLVVTPGLQLFFDTISDSRKYQNLILNPHLSFVIGWDDEQTVQYEGIASIPTGSELNRLLEIYFQTFPDGIERKENWKNIAYFCVEPKWIRYSDFRESSARIEEIIF
jgi:general stress protein 26